MFDPKNKDNVLFRAITFLQMIVLVAFFILPSNLIHAQTFSVFSLPKPGAMVTQSEKFIPPLLKGISLHKENPLVFDFLVDPGNAMLSKDDIQKESQKLIKYFLASLTIPEDDLWVNLSPYEKDRIIPKAFGETEMGRDLLAQDYILKQLSASLIYPEKDLGKAFWDKVYQKAQAKYGTTDIPVNTFNKVWIVPKKAVILEDEDTAYVLRSELKVMMEEDYVALDKNRADEVLGTDRLSATDVNQVSSLSSEIVREIIIPEIEREINEGKNFSQLRQIYNALVLAFWFKDNLKNNILNEVYSNKAKISGVDVEDKTDREKIYQQYLAAYRQGVFNYIKEDLDPLTSETIPRKYFSGGAELTGQQIRGTTESGTARELGVNPAEATRPVSQAGVQRITAALGGVPTGSDQAMLSASDKKRLQEQSTEAVLDVINRLDTTAVDAASALDDLRMLQARVEANIQLNATKDEGGKRLLSPFGDSVRRRINEIIPEIVRKQIQRYRDSGVAIQQNNIWQNEVQTAQRVVTNAPVFDAADIQVINTDRITFGVAVSDGKLFIERPILDNILADTADNFNQRTRFLIRAISPNIMQGDVNAFNYAFERFPEQITGLYPSAQALPQTVMSKVRDNLVGYLDQGNSETFKTKLNEDRRRLDPNAVEILTVISPNQNTVRKTDQLYNALNLYVYMDATKRLDRTKSDKNVRLLFAFAADPATAAHFISAGTTAMLMTDAKFGGFDPTSRDYRKAFLERTYATRLGLTRDIVSEVFGGLIDVLADTPSTQDTNGEGRQHRYLIDRVEDGSIFELDGVQYLAGQDHFLSFARDKKGLVSFKKITQQNIGDFEAYALLPGYQRLLQTLLNEDGVDVIPEQHRGLIQGIAQGTVNVRDALKVGVEFPDLDVFSKVFLMLDDIVARIAQKYGQERASEFQQKFNFGVVITPRDVTQYTDKTREAILKSGGISFRWGVEGPGDDISSTSIRNGLTQLLKFGVLNLNDFYGLFRMSLERILTNPSYQKHLLRIGKMVTGESVEQLIPEDSLAQQDERNRQGMSEFQAEVSSVLPGATIETTASESKVDFVIRGTLNQPVATISRTVTSQYDGTGAPLDTVKYGLRVDRPLQEVEVNAIESAFKKFSTTPGVNTEFERDSAMLADVSGSGAAYAEDWTADRRFAGVASVIPELRTQRGAVDFTDRGVSAILQGRIPSADLNFVLRGLELLDSGDREGALRSLDQAGVIPAALSGLSFDAFQSAIRNPTEAQRNAVNDLLSINQRTQDLIQQMESSRTTNAAMFTPDADGRLSPEGSRVKEDYTRQLKALNKLWALLAGIVNPGVVVQEADTVLTGLIPSQDTVRTANPAEAAQDFSRQVQEQLAGPGVVEKNPGGIDLNPANLKIEINKANGGVDVEFDPKLLEQIRQQGIEGFIPVIINVQPMESASPLFSQNAQGSEFATSNI